MRSAAISKLKATLSEYIAYVKGGEDVLITERGKPVARIVPVRGPSRENAIRSDLARRGILRPGKGRIPAELLRDLPVTRVRDEDLRRVMEEDRGETP